MTIILDSFIFDVEKKSRLSLHCIINSSIGLVFKLCILVLALITAFLSFPRSYLLIFLISIYNSKRLNLK